MTHGELVMDLPTSETDVLLQSPEAIQAAFAGIVDGIEAAMPEAVKEDTRTQFMGKWGGSGETSKTFHTW